MAVQFPDPNPTATSNDKNVHSKTVRILGTSFSLPGSVSVLAVLPADATILSVDFYKKTQLTGGGVTAATVSIGVPGAPTQFVNAYDALTPVAGTSVKVTPILNIMQPYNVPQGNDIMLQFTATATTGVPTAGDIYFTVNYVR